MNIDRRTVLKSGAAVTLSAATGALAPAIGRAANRVIKVGYVSPQTGPLAAFAEADKYLLDNVRAALKDGVKLGKDTFTLEISVRDSQSNPNRAAEVAKELIVRDKIDIMTVASTPETTNPVSTVCENEDVPCVSTVAPWQPWFIGRQANPADPKSWKPFNSTFHFFWGLEDIIAVFTNMWAQVQTNKSVGGLFPNDGDGNAWGDKVVGFPPVLEKLGYKLTDPGRYQNLTDNFGAQIDAFRRANAEIVTGVVIPPDFTTFWNQAGQKGFRPKVASVGKALLFPVALQALGKAGHNLSSEVWWTPTHPFKSSLTGASAAELAKGFEQATKRQWTQQIGFGHALFEVVVDSLKRSADPKDSKANIDALAATKLDTIVGPIAFGADSLPPFARKNVAKTPLVGGQWRLGADGKYAIVVVDNQTAKEIPLGGKMEPIA